MIRAKPSYKETVDYVRQFMTKYKNKLECPACHRCGTITRTAVENADQNIKERYQCRTVDLCCTSWKVDRFYNKVITPYLAREELDLLSTTVDEQDNNSRSVNSIRRAKPPVYHVIEDEDEIVEKSIDNDIRKLTRKIKDQAALSVVEKLTSVIMDLKRQIDKQPVIAQSVVSSRQNVPRSSPEPHDYSIMHTMNINGWKGDKKRKAEEVLSDILSMREKHRQPKTLDLCKTYIYGIPNNNISIIRNQLKSLDIDPRQLLNIVFVAKNVMEVVVRHSYLAQLVTSINKLEALNISILPQFNPLEPSRLGLDHAYAREQAKYKYHRICTATMNTTSSSIIKEFYQNILSCMDQSETNSPMEESEINQITTHNIRGNTHIRGVAGH